VAVLRGRREFFVAMYPKEVKAARFEVLQETTLACG